MTESDSRAPDEKGMARRVFEFEMTIAEWIGTAILLAVPYLAVGLIWTVTHTGQFTGRHGVELVAPAVRSILMWPALLLANICLT